MIGADPFKRFSPHDFDLGKRDIKVVCREAEAETSEPNVLRVEVRSPDFRIEARGFDPNRDLVVDARALA